MRNGSFHPCFPLMVAFIKEQRKDYKHEICFVKLTYFLQLFCSDSDGNEAIQSLNIFTSGTSEHAKSRSAADNTPKMTPHTFPHAQCRCDRLQGKRPAASSPPTRCCMTKLHIAAKWLLLNPFVATRVARDERRRMRGASSMVSLSILPMHGIDAYRDAYRERPASALSALSLG